MKTADLTDQHSNYQLCDPIFRSYGGAARFHGPVRTLKVFEDFSLVLQAVSDKGGGAVLVIDGGGSTRCALFGDRLAKMAVDNDWAGVIIFGQIRDSAEINRMPIGVKALGTTPIRSAKEGFGTADVSVRFAGVTFDAGSYAYADEDGIIVSPVPLHLSK
jgi:regulator of ribonuclease activity A